MIYEESANKTIAKAKCICDCGNEIIRTIDLLKAAKNPSCGCMKKENVQKSYGIDINGKKFGRLTVLKTLWEETPPKVECLCECGAIKILRKADVQSGHTRSCGCLHSEKITENNEKDWTGYISNYGVKAIKQSHKNKKGVWLWEFECPICHNSFVSLPAKVASGHTTSCGCKIKSSKERLIENYLIQNNISYISQYSFQDCKYKYKLKFDFALLDKDEVFYLIEYDGKQHFEPIDFYGGEKSFNETKNRDRIKNKYCEENNIPLLRLPYTLSDEEIINKIASIIYP